jgi:hypothetical protein
MYPNNNMTAQSVTSNSMAVQNTASSFTPWLHATARLDLAGTGAAGLEPLAHHL